MWVAATRTRQGIENIRFVRLLEKQMFVRRLREQEEPGQDHTADIDKRLRREEGTVRMIREEERWTTSV